MKKLKIREETVREACLVAGFLLFVTGIWFIYRPAAGVIGGMLLIWLGLPPRRAD